jgi:hypothetical protein
MTVRLRRVLGRVLLGLWAGCSLGVSGCSGCGRASNSGNPDAASASDGATLDATPSEPDATVANPFEGADDLSCIQLDLLWHQQQDLVAASLRACTQDTDCVLVPTAVDCKPITGQDIAVAGCDTAVAAASEAEWTQSNGALAALLCAERTLACVSDSLCPGQLVARCVSDLCRAQ